MTARQLVLFRERAADALFLLEGVRQVDVNPVLGRIVVAFDETRCELSRVVKVVDRVEATLGLDAVPFSLERPEHPGDLEPLVRCGIELGGDVLGLGMAVIGKVARLPTLPFEVDVLAVLSLFDAPRLRNVVEERIGRQTTSFVLTLSTAMAQGLVQSPLGLVVDLAYHGLVLGERLARRSAWEARETALCGAPSSFAAESEAIARPLPVPAGPIERYADAAVLASGGAFALGVAMTGSLAAASAPLLSGLPKPARLGREAFASYLAFVLARRGMVPLDRRALRRLDRIDCLVVPLELLLAFDLLGGSLVCLDGIDPALARERIAGLFDPCAPRRSRQDGLWSLSPLEQAVPARPAGYGLMALRHGDTIVAAARVQATVDARGRALLAAARSAGMRIVVATPGPDVPVGLVADEVVPAEGLAEDVRRLQREGRVVCVVAAEHGPALAAADCAVGLTRDAHSRPWGAHVLGGEHLDDARFVVEACRAARTASQQSTQLAGAAAGIGLLISLTGLSRATTERVAVAVNVGTLIAIANGVRLGATLALPPLPVRPEAPPWHALDVGDVLERLQTSLDGLGDLEALRRRVLPPESATALTRLGEAMMEQLRNPLTPLLGAGAGLSAMAGSVVDAVLVGSVVALNALVGAAQRLRTDTAIGALAGDTRRPARVRRAGVESTVDDDALVPGDVVLLRAGDAVLADCRLAEEDHLEVDESSLTGESLPVGKSVQPSRAPALAERRSMLYGGTSIAAGTATAIVVAVGEATETRRAAAGARGGAARLGVEARLESITDYMVPTAVLGGLAVAAAGLLRGRPAAEVLGAGTSLAVAGVPEGLPLLALAAQLAAAQRLSGRGTLVRNPRTIEALGRVDVVCFDKTGTVTEGRLRLRAIWLPDGERAWDRLDATARDALAAALRATPVAVAGQTLPHPTDQALVDGADHAAVTPEEGLPGWMRLAELPFEPARGYHAVLGRVPDGLRVSVKGAPEVVLDRCTAIWSPTGATVALGPEHRTRLGDEAARLAGQGLRVLAIAERLLPLDSAFAPGSVENLAFRGLVALSDPVRATAGDALRGLRDAGARALLITGDHPSTAARIADELGILDHGAVITGAELDDMDDETLAARLGTVRVFARVTPAQKVRLVVALQRAGHTVAMTGDGANDAPAIRRADVGIALGRHGTPAALDAADLVVTDDRIETLIDAVLEGRAMWVSVRDAVAVLVGGNIAELGFSVVASLFGGAPPLNPRQLLLVNLLTDIAPAMAIATRPPPETTAEALLHEGPEASLASSLTADIAWRALTTAASATGAWVTTRARLAPAQAGTVALVALVGAQLGQTLVAGGRSPLIVATGLGSFAILGSIVQTPGLSRFFGCTPLGVAGWTTALGAAGVATLAATVIPRVWPGARTWAEHQAISLHEALPVAAVRLNAWPPLAWPWATPAAADPGLGMA